MLSGSRLFVYTYDQVGNLLTSDDTAAGLGVSAFEYDPMDRLVEKTTVAGVVAYEYDLSGMKTEVTDPNLEAVQSAYDAAGRLARTTVVGSPNRESYFHYDDAGLIERKILSGNRVLSYYSYDQAGRLSQLVNLDSTASLLTYFAYQRNPNGAVTRINHESNEWTYFTYDALDRLSEERRTQNPTIYGFEYEYDAASNRTRKEDLVSAAVTSYSPNALNLIESETTGAVETVYEYDQSQRMKTRYSADEATYFSHNQRDLPTKLEFALSSGTPDNTREFRYTGTGERAALVGELGAGYETRLAYDGTRLLTEKDEFDNTYGQYRWGSPQHGGGLIESSNPAEAGPEEGPVMDERGSVDKLVGVSGRVVYDRFGVELANNLASTTRTRFVSPAFLRLGTSERFTLTPGGIYLPGPACLAVGSGALLRQILCGGVLNGNTPAPLENPGRRGFGLHNQVSIVDRGGAWPQVAGQDSGGAAPRQAPACYCEGDPPPEDCKIRVEWSSVEAFGDRLVAAGIQLHVDRGSTPEDAQREVREMWKNSPFARRGGNWPGGGIPELMPHGEERRFFLSSGPVEVTLEPFEKTRGCHLIQTYTERTNFTPPGYTEPLNDDDVPDYSPEIRQFNASNLIIMDYVGNRYTDWPYVQGSERSDPELKNRHMNWAFFQAHVFVRENPALETWWGYSGTARWNAHRRVFVIGRGRWRYRDQRPRWPLNDPPDALGPEVPAPRPGDMAEHWGT